MFVDRSPNGVYDPQQAMEQFPIGSIFWTMDVFMGRPTKVEGPCCVEGYPIKALYPGTTAYQRVEYVVAGLTQDRSLDDLVNEWHGMFRTEAAALVQAKLIGTPPTDDF